MKQIKILFFTILAACLLALSACGKTDPQPPVTICVANDLHYLSPTLLGESRVFHTPSSYFDGKTVPYSPAITDALLAEVIDRQPRALILAGDLTLNGARASHRELAQKLEAVKAAGIDVLLIPGNHDIDGTAVDYSTDPVQEAPPMTSKEFFALYDPLLPEELISRDESTFSYLYLAGENLWLLMLDANLNGKGFVKDSTFTWLESQLKTAKRKGIKVISVTHQNLYAHSELLSFGYTLYNADKLLELYEKYDVACNLSGHIHIQSIKDKAVPEIVTASLSVTGNRYGWLLADGRQLTYTARSVDVAAHAQKAGLTDPNLLDFGTYGTWYFEEVARNQARETLADQGLSAQQVELLAETYALINSAYFRGDLIRQEPFAQGLDLWRQHSSFISTYIDSMLASDGEKLHYTVKLR